jgi:DNA-binding GntR family transcriptional regulator
LASSARLSDPPKGLTPLSQLDRIADIVHASLREAIFSGELKPGSKLSVPALAGRLGVSRSPVREAVLRLTQERLAQEEARRGAVVARIGASELVRIYELREVLEGLAARLAVEHSGRRMVEELRAALEDHARAVDAGSAEAHTKADMRFHRIVREASANDGLIEALEGIQAQVRLAMVTTTVTAGPHLALADHRSIFQAIERGDPQGAERAAREHIVRLRRNLQEVAKAG